MKKIVMVAVLGLFVSAASGLAQTVYDGAKLTGKDLNGTCPGLSEWEVLWGHLVEIFLP